MTGTEQRVGRPGLRAAVEGPWLAGGLLIVGAVFAFIGGWLILGLRNYRS